MRIKYFSLALAIFLLSSCASNIYPPPYKRYSTADIKIYDTEALSGQEYASLGEVKGVDCSPTWFRFSNSDNAMQKLIKEALEKGANGVINVSCWDSGIGPVAWCNNSATCKGEAVVFK